MSPLDTRGGGKKTELYRQRRIIFFLSADGVCSSITDLTLFWLVTLLAFFLFLNADTTANENERSRQAKLLAGHFFFFPSFKLFLQRRVIYLSALCSLGGVSEHAASTESRQHYSRSNNRMQEQEDAVCKAMR